MNYTTDCTRVPNTQETNFSGSPADIGSVPAILGQLPEPVSSIGTNDGTALNPSGQAAPDNEGMRSKLVSCRNRTFISTFNTRTLNPASRLNELIKNAKDQKIDIIAIQEHHFFHPETDIVYHKIEDYHLATSPCLKNFPTLL